MDVLLSLTVCFVVLFALYRLLTARTREWKRLLTLSQYVTAYPSAKTAHGMRCCECGSSQLRNFGLDDALDNRRYVRCVHCDTVLYRIHR
jgi:predicted SprT family Zn-dependent metalloprotease